jgi:hypothetical protein
MSKEMQANILAGIVANLITTSSITILGVVTFTSIFLVERQRLLRFFGIHGNMPKIHIYVSRLQVQPGGTKGAEPLKNGYIGPAIIQIEYLGALLVSRLFRSKFLALIPQGLKDLLSAVHVTLTDVDITIDVSPTLVTDEVLSENLILVGGGIYNYISLHYLNQQNTPYFFSKNEKGERTLKVRSGIGNIELEGRSSSRELAIIERINDSKRGTSIFICAGLGSSASFGSVRYLVQNWKKLQQHYGQAEFAFCLAFDNQSPDDHSVIEPKRVHEAPMDLV